MKSRIVRNDFKPLERFVKGLSEKHVLRVGIFSGKAGRYDKTGDNNPTIGALMEFGSVSKGIPARSWLMMPLHKKREAIIEETKKTDLELLAQGKVLLWFQRLGVRCTGAIDQAFNTRGFGTWKKNAPSTIARKGSDSPLIDTAQLRRSVASQVK